MPSKIVRATSASLRQKSKPIKEITPSVKKIAEEMVDYLDDHSQDKNRPIGLSACQLGSNVRMMAFYGNPQSSNREDIIILINPELVYGKGQHIVNEGCVSIPGKVYQLKRYKLVKIKGTTLNGNSRSFRGRDLLGHVFQHELNHLDGVLVDSIGELVVK